MKVISHLHTMTALPPEERFPGTSWIGICVGAGGGIDLEAKREIPNPAGQEPRSPSP
jgi:hypothetical protein